MTHSLGARLLVAVSLLLVVFFGATIFLLDLAFGKAAENAIGERLYVQIIVLLAAAEPGADGTLTVPELPEARFLTPGSELYGQIDTPDGAEVWRSPSAVGSGLEPLPAATGETRFQRARTLTGEPVFAMSLGVDWEFPDGSVRPFLFTAAESLAPYHAQIRRFRRQLFGWFGLLTVAILSAQVLLLRTLLRPLRRVEQEIAQIEEGARATLGEGYPRELEGVTASLNTLLEGERERLGRYRDTLGNLAHSLKTPLAVIRSTVDERPEDEQSSRLDAQVQRMEEIVSYQLQRAAAWGATTLGQAAVPVGPAVAKVTAALEKVYAERCPRADIEVSEDARFYGEQGDLLEILGNLLDNAFKWSRAQVRLRAQSVHDTAHRRTGLRLVVEDDGPGIRGEDAARVLTRGERADERRPGHGIGLSIVREILSLHGGELAIDSSPLGGARIEVQIPPR